VESKSAAANQQVAASTTTSTAPQRGRRGKAKMKPQTKQLIVPPPTAAERAEYCTICKQGKVLPSVDPDHLKLIVQHCWYTMRDIHQ
jgi:hypothetical protein